jgi:hypothetical protein
LNPSPGETPTKHTFIGNERVIGIGIPPPIHSIAVFILEEDNDQTNLLNPSPGETPTKEIENRRVPGFLTTEV